MKTIAWIVEVPVPYLVLVTGFLSMRGGGEPNFAGKAFDLGYDACILGIGISAALLGSNAGTGSAVAGVGVFVLALGFFFSVILKRTDESDLQPVSKARLC